MSEDLEQTKDEGAEDFVAPETDSEQTEEFVRISSSELSELRKDRKELEKLRSSESNAKPRIIIMPAEFKKMLGITLDPGANWIPNLGQQDIEDMKRKFGMEKMRRLRDFIYYTGEPIWVHFGDRLNEDIEKRQREIDLEESRKKPWTNTFED